MNTEYTQNMDHSTPQETLTKRQNEVLSVIKEHLAKHGAPPTRAEIAKELGFRSVNAAEDHLKALARKGAIALFPGTSRGIQLIGKHALGIPVVAPETKDSILPPLTEQQAHHHIDSELFHQTVDFLFRVPASFSTTQLECVEGDLLALAKQPLAEEGQLVLVQQGTSLSLEQYSGTLNAFEPNEIVGTVLGLIRRLIPR